MMIRHGFEHTVSDFMPMKLRTVIFIAILSFCFASCAHSFRTAEQFLDEIEARLETQPDSAFVALDSLDRSLLGTKELRARHALLYTIALEKVGMEITSDSIINIAVDYYSSSGDEEMKEKALYYKNIIDQNAASVHKDTLALQQQKMIEERYTDKQAIIDRGKSIWLLCLLVVLVVAVLIVIVRLFRKTHNELKRKPDDEAMAIIRERMSVLDKFLASRLSSDCSFDKAAEAELDRLVSDQDDFLRSLVVLFRDSHPEFVAELKSHGLTDWEVGYCCLYVLGLKGKDVGNYLKKKRNYIISSDIRRKLGLSEHDTNLGIWLRSRLSAR